MSNGPKVILVQPGQVEACRKCGEAITWINGEWVHCAGKSLHIAAPRPHGKR